MAGWVIALDCKSKGQEFESWTRQNEGLFFFLFSSLSLSLSLSLLFFCSSSFLQFFRVRTCKDSSVTVSNDFVCTARTALRSSAAHVKIISHFHLSLRERLTAGGMDHTAGNRNARRSTNAGSIPRSSQGFFSQSQLSVHRHSPTVFLQPPCAVACSSLRAHVTNEIPNAGSYTILSSTGHSNITGVMFSGACPVPTCFPSFFPATDNFCWWDKWKYCIHR